MHPITTPDSRLGLSNALRLMTEALDMLDEHRAPGAIGSTLDLAIAKLERFLDRDDQAVIAVHELIPELQLGLAAATTKGEFSLNPWDIPSV